MHNANLNNIKVGDRVGPIRLDSGIWTGVLRTVTAVTPKRFSLGGTSVYEKSTGQEVGRGPNPYCWVLASAEMIAAYEAKRDAETRQKQAEAAFEQHPAYGDATAICWALSEMTYSKNPLDRLTPAEWAELRRKLGA